MTVLQEALEKIKILKNDRDGYINRILNLSQLVTRNRQDLDLAEEVELYDGPVFEPPMLMKSVPFNVLDDGEPVLDADEKEVMEMKEVENGIDKSKLSDFDIKKMEWDNQEEEEKARKREAKDRVDPLIEAILSI
jgi:hypothetical protein